MPETCLGLPRISLPGRRAGGQRTDAGCSEETHRSGREYIKRPVSQKADTTADSGEDVEKSDHLSWTRFPLHTHTHTHTHHKHMYTRYISLSLSHTHTHIFL